MVSCRQNGRGKKYACKKEMIYFIQSFDLFRAASVRGVRTILKCNNVTFAYQLR